MIAKPACASETLETHIPPLVASTQADPASRQPDHLAPAMDIHQLQLQLTSTESPSPANVTPEVQTTRGERRSEPCTVCGFVCISVELLQDHLLSEHCRQNPEITSSLKYLYQQLESVIANQTAQLVQMDRVEKQQIGTNLDVIEIKKALLSPKNQQLAPPQGRRVPLLTPPHPIAHRSFFPKFNNFLDIMKTLNLTLGLHSEIWEDKEKKDHMNKIEEALEIEGVQYISNPRPNRRGGGAAISLLAGEFNLTKLDVIQPNNLEVVWGLVRPNKPNDKFKGIIICSFYSVPNSKTKKQLVQHITINYTELKARYKDHFFLTRGDINDLNVRNILDISPTLHLHNTKPTNGRKNIDILVSDMAHLYMESEIIPNVPTDIPDGQPGGGKPSDHPIVLCEPRLETGSKPARQVVTKKTRRFDEERKRKMAQWIQHESWESVYNGNDASGMAEKFDELITQKLDELCPEEVVKITQFDGKITSLALQKLVRKKKREFEKHGYSTNFKELKKKVKERIKLEGEKALNKVLENATEKGAKWIRESSRLSARPGEDQSSSFSPLHI